MSEHFLSLGKAMEGGDLSSLAVWEFIAREVTPHQSLCDSFSPGRSLAFVIEGCEMRSNGDLLIRNQSLLANSA